MKKLATLLGSLVLAFNASALTLTVADAEYQWTFTPPSEKTAAEVQTYLESQGESFGGEDLQQLFKNDNSNTSFTPNGVDFSAYGNLWLFVKDGNHTPTAYLFDLTGYTGEQIILSGLWPNGGNISHSTILGTPGGTSVPDGGSAVLLMGIALAGLGSVRRFIKS